MKDVLYGFHRPNDEEFKNIWQNCTFVLDTNFLLNLYRYEASTRDELLQILALIQARLWLPYYAALEFQRNRPKVIADQKKKFSEVRKIISKFTTQLDGELSHLQLRKRHGLINPDSLMVDLKALFDKFLAQLGDFESKQIDIHQDLDLRSKIESLFSGRVGRSLTTTWVSDVIKEGQERFAHKVPPGYCDIGKGSEADPSFSYGGVLFDRKFGDLFIWKEIIEYAKSLDKPDIVFLTDDAKEDWWWTIESGGQKRVGPRPELLEEMRRSGNAREFYIYSTEQFLKLSKDYLAVQVSDEAISEVREVAYQNRIDGADQKVIRKTRVSVENWLQRSFPGYEHEFVTELYPDFILCTADGEKRLAIEYMVNPNVDALARRVELTVGEIEAAMVREDLEDAMVFIVLHMPSEKVIAVKEQVDRIKTPRDGIQLLFGNIEVVSNTAVFRVIFTVGE